MMAKQRAVLLLGDQGAALWTGQRLHQLSPSAAEAMPALVEQLAGNHTLDITLDSQSILVERVALPNLAIFDRRLLLRRRAEALHTDPLAYGHITLGSAASGFDAAVAAIPSTASLREWLQQLHAHQVTVRRWSFLPFELTKLQQNSLLTEGTWQFVFFLTRCGGLRQLVFHQKRLILTRSQPADPDTVGSLIAKAVSALKDYLARHGLQSLSEVAVTIIGSNKTTEGLDDLKPSLRCLKLVTCATAAQQLNLYTLPADTLTADALLLDWIARQPRLAMKLNVEGSSALRHRFTFNTTAIAYGAMTAATFCMLITSGIVAKGLQEINHARAGLSAKNAVLVPQQTPVLWAELLLHCDDLKKCVMPLLAPSPTPWPFLRQTLKQLGNGYKLGSFYWSVDDARVITADFSITPRQPSGEQVADLQAFAALNTKLQQRWPNAIISMQQNSLALDPKLALQTSETAPTPAGATISVVQPP